MTLRIGLGFLAIGIWAFHAAQTIWEKHPENILWVCNLANLAIGLGLLMGLPQVNGLGASWLLLGAPLWIIDLLGNGKFRIHSLFTHLVSLGIGLYGLNLLGMPNGIWWKALLMLAFVQQISRWLTPRQKNVNLAFAVWAGWERLFPSYAVYRLILLTLSAGIFFGAERLWKIWSGR